MEPLRELFRHHAWATETLIAHCATLPPEALESTVPGTAGTIRHTLTHLVAADDRYLQRLDGEAPGVRESEPPSLAELQEHVTAQARRWEAVLDRVDELDVTIGPRGDWPGAAHAQNLLLVQALHHGNDHRTHVGTILGACDLPNVDVSGWSYWEAKGGA